MFNIWESRGRKQEENYVDQCIKIYVTKAEKEKIKIIASRNGMNVSCFVRFLIRNRYNKIFSDLSDDYE